REAGLKNTQAIKAVELAKEAKRETSAFEQAWLKAFNLESLDQPFIPKFSQEVQEALEPVLKGEQIKLTRGSLAKLEKRQREEFLPLIKPTLEEPNAVLDNGRGILFIKEFIDPDKNRYFMSVAKNYDGEWIFSSHMRKDFSTIKNEFARSKVLYTGFSGGEVAGASDILESGGTAIKPSDLQINTPPSHGSALNPASKNTKPPLKTPKIEPNPAFGQHFKEFELKGAQAVAKLLQEQRGQVAGAFYREDLGYIDLVWGNVGVGKTKGIGLSKILDKHADDFKGFVGNTPEEKVASGIKKIIDQGELKEVDGVKTIYLNHKENIFKVGLSQGWDHEGNNHWVITAYKVRTPSVQLSDQAQPSKGMGYSSPKGEHDSTKPPLKVQARPWGNGVSAEPEEIVKIVRQTFGPVAMQRLEFSIKHHKGQIGEYKEELKRLRTEHAQMLEGTHPYHTLDPEHNQAIIEAIKKRENTAKLVIESFQAKIQTAQNTLEAYRIWKEVKDNLTPLEELKINFYNTERLARENVAGASGNARLIERLQGEVSTQKYLAGLSEECAPLIEKHHNTPKKTTQHKQTAQNKRQLSHRSLDVFNNRQFTYCKFDRANAHSKFSMLDQVVGGYNNPINSHVVGGLYYR
ncbi:PBECR2 nuclease fold domain-containing protein, partial [Helicobacter bizzozeronii]|uniref:putative barnase/colicin E5 family endoribonuclease n=1 Tax=Helicobacter bizzozeronii TaxID=56877 RepID=UPI001FF8E0E9